MKLSIIFFLVSLSCFGQRIDALTAASAADGTELMHVYQGGASRKLSVDQIRTFIGTAGNLPSGIFPTITSFQQAQQRIGPGLNDMPLEFVNYGYTSGTDSIHWNTTGLMRLNGRISLVRNMEWDSVNAKWLTPLKDATAYGSVAVELGGEAVILHASPPGVNLSDVPHENLLSSAIGTDGPTLDKITSGYYVQSKAPIFTRYSAQAYNPALTNNTWNTGSSTQPMLWITSREAKGTINEFARWEMNSDNSAAWPAQYFAKSRGSLQTPTIAVTNEITGRMGWSAYDGTDYEITAAIEGVTRGTMASNSIGQELRILTSPTTTANLTTRMAFGNDGAIKNYTPWRYEYPSITTIPNYTTYITSPVLSSGSVGQIQQLSTATGGLRFLGFSTTSTSASAIPLLFSGILGATAPTAPAVLFVGNKHNGATSVADLAATEIVAQFRNNATNLIEILGNGNAGFGVTTPTSRLHTTALATAYVAKTALYTLTAADFTVEVTSGTHTQTLPTAVGITGRQYVVTNTGSGTVTVGTTSSQTFINVSGTPTTLTLAQFETAWVQSNGGNWLRLK